MRKKPSRKTERPSAIRVGINPDIDLTPRSAIVLPWLVGWQYLDGVDAGEHRSFLALEQATEASADATWTMPVVGQALLSARIAGVRTPSGRTEDLVIDCEIVDLVKLEAFALALVEAIPIAKRQAEEFHRRYTALHDFAMTERAERLRRESR